MDIAYNQFASEVVKIVHDISESHFIAFDLEFSGIAPPSRQRSPGKPTLQQLYEESKLAATKFQILQVGLSIVKEDLKNGQYVVKPYNFNISPIPTLRERQFNREWSMSSGAVQFLLKNKFDFGLPFTHGIPYLSRAEEIQARLKMGGEDDRKRPDMILKSEDDKLIKHIRDSIIKWQNEAEDTKENYLNIPNDDRGKGVPGALNRYQMRLTHQIVQNEFPHLKTTSMRDFVQVTNPTAEQRDRAKIMQKEFIDREIGRAVGFRWIFEAIIGRDISGMPDDCFLAAVSHFGMGRNELTPFQSFVADLNEKLRSRRRVLIGHNCFTDLIYLHQFLLGELPDRIEDFQDSISDIFPAIIDTKHIASFGNGRWSDTSLTAVEDDLRGEETPKIFIPPEFDRYALDEKPHEAGYDALLTATIAIKLSAKMEREGTYYDQETFKPIESSMHYNAARFGTKEEGYVTASEDIGSHTSDVASSGEKASPTTILEKEEHRTNTLAVAPTNPQSALPTSEEEQGSEFKSSVVAVKEKRSRPKSKSVNWNSTAEVEKVRSAFSATNIYDVLQDPERKTVQEEDLMSFSDPESSTDDRWEMSKAPDLEDMVKQGKVMPRWDGGNGFWQLFGNKLQVNSSKEGVCNL